MTSQLEQAETMPRARAHSLAPPRSGVRLGSLPADSDQELRFIQDRLGSFAKTTFGISSMFLVATSIADLAGTVRRFSTIGRTYHVVGTVLALVLWRVTRSRRDIAPRTLQALDLVGTIGICWCFAAMGHYSSQPYAFYTGLLAMTHVSITRAMIVPSVPRRTLLLGMTCFAGLVLSRATMPWPADILPTAGPRSRGIIEAVLWSTAGTAVATVASTVIYGLQEKAREARQLGQYTLEQKIGEGAMGEVYRARHAMLRRPTAVKLLSGDGSEDQLRRFEKEVQLTALLTHPNTISIFDYGRTPDGIFYYAMEMLEGATLEQVVARHGPLPAGRVIHILLQVCGALKEAHRVGLIHRDIKPANIHLGERGDIHDFVKVLDFGLVREVKEETDVVKSNVDAVVGTPLYLAPEAILTPARVDARADIYGVGCVAFYLVTGTTAFTGRNVVEVCAQHLYTAPPRPSERQPVPDDLERVILACLAKDPAERPQSAEALAEMLAACRDHASWTEHDAETWWSTNGSADLEPPPVDAASAAELPRRTFVRIDLEQRTKARERGG